MREPPSPRRVQRYDVQKYVILLILALVMTGLLVAQTIILAGG